MNAGLPHSSLMAETAVRQELVVNAPPARVFEAWTDPLHVARWYVERADGDPREDSRVAWVIAGSTEPFEVNVCAPSHRLVLTHVGEPPWRGTVIDIALRPERGGTRVIVEHYAFPAALRGHVPVLRSGWACNLAVLREYVERHWDQRLDRVEARMEVDPNPLAVATALRDAESIRHWAEEAPERVLASTAHGAVFALRGFPGVYVVSGAGAVSVWYATWGGSGSDAREAQRKTQELAGRFVARVQAIEREVR